MKTRTFLLKFLPRVTWGSICLLWCAITIICNAHPVAILFGPATILIATLSALITTEMITYKKHGGRLSEYFEHPIKALLVLTVPIILWTIIFIVTGHNRVVLLTCPIIVIIVTVSAYCIALDP